MTSGREHSEDDADEAAPASLIDALLVYAEPLAVDAHAVVLGDAESSIAERLLELGARAVHVFDPDPARAANAAREAPRGVTVRALVADLDVRDGAFDLAIVPDLAELDDPRAVVARLRRAVAGSGAVVAMGRAKVAASGDEDEPPFGAELGPAALAYGELYDAFAAEFEDVSLAGVVPFAGVVFAELGGTTDEAPAVSVDTRLASSPAPSVFVVVASERAPGDRRGRRPELDPYAIVQVSSPGEPAPDSTLALEAALAAAQLKAELLTVQLDESRDRLVVADVRSVEAAARLDRAAGERDAALTRAMELETVLAASQQTLGTLEHRLLQAEQGTLERDDRIAALSAELDTRRSAEAPTIAIDVVDIGEVVTRAERAEAALAAALADIATREENAATHVDTRLPDVTAIIARAERAEAALALNVADLAQLAEAHAAETAAYEQQLRDRARVVAGLEKELVRREELVRELVTSLEESREGVTNGVFEVAAPLPPPAPRVDPAAAEAAARLRHKLDELASEVARREGELTARAWRITELENERARLVADAEKAASRPASAEAPKLGTGDASAELSRALTELDALRQALAQEHAARVAAESGEALSHARSELARQAALLEQMRGRAESS
ncbi:MAG: hypothetical protein KF764_31395 [Labilithrix sp.]|nr:hypothetical protein [Labilithrix sp.]